MWSSLGASRAGQRRKPLLIELSPPPHGASFSHLLSFSPPLWGPAAGTRVRHVLQQVLMTQIATEEKKSAPGHVADLGGGGLLGDSSYTGGPGTNTVTISHTFTAHAAGSVPWGEEGEREPRTRVGGGGSARGRSAISQEDAVTLGQEASEVGKASATGSTSLRETPAPGLEGLVWDQRLSPRVSPPRGMSPDAK